MREVSLERTEYELSVSVVLSDGKVKEFDDEGEKEYQYSIAAGILSIVEKDGNAWRVYREYSPIAWHYVDGTRRRHGLDNLPGFDRKLA